MCLKSDITSVPYKNWWILHPPDEQYTVHLILHMRAFVPLGYNVSLYGTATGNSVK